MPGVDSNAAISAGQAKLFPGAVALPDWCRYAEEVLSAADEAELVARSERLPLADPTYREWTAKRRIVSYGGRYDFGRNELEPALPIPRFLHELRAAATAFAGIPAEASRTCASPSYSPGTELGWHREVPQFERIGGVSLLGPARWQRQHAISPTRALRTPPD